MKEKIKFFNSLFGSLNRWGIKYGFLRGYEFIFDNSKKGELDVIIRKKDLRKVKEIVRNIEGSYQIKHRIDLTHPFLVRFVQPDFVVDFDFQAGGIGYCGSVILDDDYLLKNRIRKKGFEYLKPEAEFLMLFVQGFIFKKKLKYFDEHKKKFFNLYNGMDRDIVEKKFAEIFNRSIVKEVLELIQKKDLKRLFKLRGRFVRMHLSRKPWRVVDVLISKAMRFRNYFHLDRFFFFINPFRWAPLVSFIGSDGSGKTTLSKNTKEYFDKFGINSILMQASVFSSLKVHSKKAVSYSQKVSSKSSSLKNFIRLIMQIPKQVRIAYYRKKGILVITDRYSYDLIFLYGAEGINRFLVKVLSQKPSRCFYVKVKPKIIHKRNSELNLDAIKTLIKRVTDNKDYLDLTDLENKDMKKTKINLEKNLWSVIKNV